MMFDQGLAHQENVAAIVLRQGHNLQHL